MKDIIAIEINTKKVSLENCRTDMLVIGIFSEEKKLDKQTKAVDKQLDNAISNILELGDFKGKENSGTVVYCDSRIPAKRVFLVGLGEKKKADLNTIRKAVSYAANKAVSQKIENIALALHINLPGRINLVDCAKAIAEGAYFGGYRYDEFVTQSDDDRLKNLNVTIIDGDPDKIRKLKKGTETGKVVGKAQSAARTIANRPGNIINPPELAKIAREIAKGYDTLSCTIFDEKQLAQKGMGGILAVGSGSKTPPRLIVIQYRPKRAAAKKTPAVAIVGKAVTFDSGGISLKPGANMDQMKFDKSGGISALATVQAVAELNLPINLCAIIPSAENMPSGSSFRPGDIVSTYSGKTVEILNTDAEGRMILCDGITYAVELKCDIIIDIATLTGACIVALGKHMAGVMSNDNKLVNDLKKAADQSGENIWHLPSGEEYAKDMKSKIADLKNLGPRWGGACTAAAFLKEFADDKKWAHLDIAGMDLFDKPTSYSAQGSSGFGVRLLTQYLINLTNK